jgi:hypothetical protein
MLLTFHTEEHDQAQVDAATVEEADTSGLHTPPPMSSPKAPPPIKPGYRQSLRAQRRLARTQYKDARLHPIDMCFENPLDGAFKCHEGVVALYKAAKGLVVRRETSYCHYGVSHRKRTFFLTSVLQFEPRLPCPAVPCEPLRGRPAQLRRDLDDATELDLDDFEDPVFPEARHQTTIASLGTEERNRIPFPLLKLLIYAWCKNHVKYGAATIRTFLIVDAFSGWGSLAKLVDEMHAQGKWGKIKVFSNDIVRRDHTDLQFDMACRADALTILVQFALKAHAPDVLETWKELSLRDALWHHNVALLLHFSTPCETYSVDGLGTHRRRQETPNGLRYIPVTDAAKKADRMNHHLLEWVSRECGLVHE